MMQPDELSDLVDDIKQNGLIEPVVLYEDKILDGRNRYLACGEAGIKPHYEYYKGDEPVGYVVSKNLHRRHLNETQRGTIGDKIANMRQGERTDIEPNLNLEKVSLDKAADLVNVSRATISNVRKVRREAPELMPKLESGEMTAHEAVKIIKKDKRDKQIQEQIKEIEQNDFTPPTKKYDVIVVDPPWPYGTKYDPNGRRAANPYPEMSLDDIKAIELPASDDCVLWLWTTHKFMRYSFDILDAWGFRDVAIITWVKDRMGLGTHIRSQSEFCIMALRGKPTINLTNQTTVVNGKLKEHSRKPDEFYEMVNSLCVGYKLDYFSREQREGWDQYGNDTNRF
jgi:N6-adenosine-specific RNA methylase IME4